MDGDSAQVVLLIEGELEPGVKVERVPKFCYLGDTEIEIAGISSQIATMEWKINGSAEFSGNNLIR